MQGTQQISGEMNSKRPTPKGVKIRHLKDNKDLVSSRRDASYSHTGDSGRCQELFKIQISLKIPLTNKTFPHT